MKLFDRFLLREFLKFMLLALSCVVGIYILIDLFEDLSYFLSRKVPLLTLLQYYAYYTPSAVNLLFPVSFILGCFMTYGRLARQRELAALQSAGVDTYRLFRPLLLFGVIAAGLFYFGNEYVAIPASIALENMKRYAIEKRPSPGNQLRRDMNYLADDGRIFYAREFDPKGTLRNFVVVELDPQNRRIVRRIDGDEAGWNEGVWRARRVNVRVFPTDTTEILAKHDTLSLTDIATTPQDMALEARPVEQMRVGELRNYIQRLRRSGSRVDKEMVEFQYRFSYPIIGFVLLLMGLPLATRLRRGGVMLGLGLGLLFSFLYWGAIQTCKAFGQSGVLSPFIAAWLPNIVFLVAGLALLPSVKR